MAAGIVQVISVPDGEAPEEIRKAWIGCTFAAIFFPDAPLGTVGVESSEQVLYQGGCWGVPVEKALEALEYAKTDPGTADNAVVDRAIAYWKDKGWPTGTMLMFKECEVLVL